MHNIRHFSLLKTFQTTNKFVNVKEHRQLKRCTYGVYSVTYHAMFEGTSWTVTWRDSHLIDLRAFPRMPYPKYFSITKCVVF